MKTSPLLINEPPLQVLPSLAVAIGLSEALVVQQVHYWLGRSTNERDGRLWVYRTYPEWKQEFPFWSEDTIGRIFRKLEEIGVLLATDKFNQMATDRTKWYSINYEELNRRVPQVAMLEGGKLPSSRAPQNAMLLPETTQETTTNAGRLLERHFAFTLGAIALEPWNVLVETFGAEEFETALIATVNEGGGRKMNINYVKAILERKARERDGDTGDINSLLAAMEADINGR